MKIVLAPDSFKGSMSALQACRAMKSATRRVFPDAQIVALPLADGGEGTLDVVMNGAGGMLKTQRVRGPLGAPVEARWGILPDGRAIIEMAQASGLHLTESHDRRDALRASSWGTGQLIKAALNAGCRHIMLGIGGSATTDGGVGTLSALGLFARDSNARILPEGGGALAQLASLDLKFLDARLQRTQFTVLCDVNNPLCGPQGAAHIYAPQKGATPAQTVQLDDVLAHFADVAEKTLGHDYRNLPGAGAAGGLGFALTAFCGAQLRSGIETILEITQFREKINGADLILTGEGSLDAQTLCGKTIAGLCKIARERSIPVIAFAGQISLDRQQFNELGLASAHSLVDQNNSSAHCLAHGAPTLANKVEQVLVN